MALAVLWLAAAPALAADDAGTRSMLSAGAGPRALALGGAFAGLANDASAPLWNPAGLGRVERAEAQFAQAQYGLDFTESVAAAVLPDWRWGALGVVIRHFGTGGIEARDSRNTLVPGELTSAESEIALAYGRALGPAWSVGASAKFRRQDVAGRAGSGVGADLGVHLRPAVALGLDDPWVNGLQIGFAMRNVIEPAIRLDQESVSDPSAARVGLALDAPLTGPLALTVTFDIEKARDAGASAHAGVEVRPHPRLVLRGGLDRGTLTAGTGLHLGSAEFAYAFEDQVTGPSHRAGLGFRFGLPVDEARERAALQAEERFAERLAESERRRDAERLAGLLDRATAARARGDLDQGLALAATARILDPAAAGPRSLEAALLGDRGRALAAAGDPGEAAVVYQQALALTPADTALVSALARSRAESDARARRTAELRGRFAEALQAFGADRLAAARAGFTAVLAAQPGDLEARAMLERVQRAIGSRTRDLLRRATLLLRAGQPGEAGPLLAQARELDPEAPGLAAVAADLERAPAVPRPAADAGPRATAPAPPSAAQERELATYYRRALEASSAGRAGEALRFWELVWSIRPGYQRVDEYLKREYLTGGMEHFAADRLIEAVALWERALQVDPRDPRALAYLARAHEQLERARAIGGDRP